MGCDVSTVLSTPAFKIVVKYYKKLDIYYNIIIAPVDIKIGITTLYIVCLVIYVCIK